jgi:hypothetical protein
MRAGPEAMKKKLLDPVLQPIDEIAIRYYNAQREAQKLHPLERMRLLKDGAVLGGGTNEYPDDLAAFDKAHAKADRRTQLVMDTWYKSGDPAYLKAARIGVSRSGLYTLWRSALWYFKGQLEKKLLTT